MASLNFNAQNVAPHAAFEPIPAGWYVVRITGSEMKPTRDRSGAFLALELTVCEGAYANRKLFDRLNLMNNSEVAVDIAQRTLSAICHATGVFQVSDSAQLHGIPLQAKVSLRPAETIAGKSYEASNEVQGYRYANGSNLGGAGAPVAGAPTAPSAPASAPVAPPQQYTAPASAPTPPQYTAPVAPAAPVAPPQTFAAPAPQQFAAPAPAPAPATQAASAPTVTPPWATPTA